MMDNQKPVTPEQEAANAAYHYRKVIQEQTANALREEPVRMTKEQFQWWADRLCSAFDREKETEQLARVK